MEEKQKNINIEVTGSPTVLFKSLNLESEPGNTERHYGASYYLRSVIGYVILSSGFVTFAIAFNHLKEIQSKYLNLGCASVGPHVARDQCPGGIEDNAEYIIALAVSVTAVTLVNGLISRLGTPTLPGKFGKIEIALVFSFILLYNLLFGEFGGIDDQKDLIFVIAIAFVIVLLLKRYITSLILLISNRKSRAKPAEPSQELTMGNPINPESNRLPGSPGLKALALSLIPAVAAGYYAAQFMQKLG